MASTPLSKITSVGWKTPRPTHGYIEFITAGMDGKVEFSGWFTRQFEPIHAAVQAAL